MTRQNKIEKKTHVEEYLFDTAHLTAAGVRFHAMNFYSPVVTSVLLADLRKGAGRRRLDVIIRWNPADAGAVSVWNGGGKLRPHFVTLHNADGRFEGLSFRHWEMFRNFAGHQRPDFDSNADLWEARKRLRKHWVGPAGKSPTRAAGARSSKLNLVELNDLTSNESGRDGADAPLASD